MHKSSCGLCVLGKKNLRNVTGHSSRRVICVVLFCYYTGKVNIDYKNKNRVKTNLKCYI